MSRIIGQPNERGVVLLGAVVMVSMLTVLGVLSLNLAEQEIRSTAAVRDEAVARNLAESGADLIMQWFHDPQSTPFGQPGNLFVKQNDNPDTGPSFFDAQGKSQFTGTADNPDLSYDAGRPDDDRLLNDPSAGWFRSLQKFGKILKLHVYGPARPGLLCTVEVTGGKNGIVRTLSFQLGTRTIPSLRAGVQVGISGLTGPATLPPSPLPVWVHWGDLKAKGDVDLGDVRELPAKTDLADVTGRSYGDMTTPEDRWIEYLIGGEALYGQSAANEPPVPPANVYPQQDPLPGLRVDRWDYEEMKNHALLYGSYYVLGRDGLLYPKGNVQPGLGQSPDDVFKSNRVGDHHGMVFVDTLDQQPPGPHNLGTVSIQADYAEGLFVVNAHVHWSPRGAGQSVPAWSPPPEGSSSLASRIPVQLNGVHFQGVFYTAGDMVYEGNPRMYGALVVGGTVSRASARSSPLEVWYNHDLGSGLVQGMPLVFLASGTWQEKY